MELRLQLHSHTTASRGNRIPVESIIRPEDAIDTLAKNNINVLAVTDHNTTVACSKVRDYAKNKGIVVINGIEINTVDGHLIGLGIDLGIEKKLNKNMSALEVADIIKDSGGEVYVPHPFSIKREGMGIEIKNIDGIVEVFNPMNIFGFENKFADLVASKLKLPKAVGADAHTLGMITSNITVIDSEPDEIEILKTLRKGETRFENCRYMSLREMKEWALERTTLSYDFIMNNIKNNWVVDRWYMSIANLKPFKILEKKVLNLGVKNKKNLLWDCITYFSYILAHLYGQSSKREFYEFISTL